MLRAPYLINTEHTEYTEASPKIWNLFTFVFSVRSVFISPWRCEAKDNDEITCFRLADEHSLGGV